MLEAQQWPWEPGLLDDPKTIEKVSLAWIAEKRIAHYFSEHDLLAGERVHLPKPQELFDLAADSIVGPHPSMCGKRLNVVREMCRIPARSLFGFFPTKERSKALKPGRKRTTSEQRMQESRERSAKSQLSQFESNKRKPSTELLASLSKVYCVNRRWLETGAIQLTGHDYELFPYQRRSDAALAVVPAWLHPYLHAVESALFVMEEISGPLSSAHQVMDTLFTREADWIHGRPSRARWLPWFPFSHAAILSARDRYLSVLPRALQPPLTRSWVPMPQQWELRSDGRLHKLESDDER